MTPLRYEGFTYKCYECTNSTRQAYFRADSLRVLCRGCARTGGRGRWVVGIGLVIVGVGLGVLRWKGII